MQPAHNDDTVSLFIDASTVMARVEVIDANDQAPIFLRSTLSGAVMEEAEFGTSVTRIIVCFIMYFLKF